MMSVKMPKGDSDVKDSCSKHTLQQPAEVHTHRERGLLQPTDECHHHFSSTAHQVVAGIFSTVPIMKSCAFMGQ